MGLLDTRYCGICGNDISPSGISGVFGSRELEDGWMCGECAARLSPFTPVRQGMALAEIKGHLAYREANRIEVVKFKVTRAFGSRTRVLLDDDEQKFIVTRSDNWRRENPDVIPFSRVIGCQSEARGKRGTHKERGFYLTIYINSPFFSEIEIKLNDGSIGEHTPVEFHEYERQASEIRQALTQAKQEVSDGSDASVTP